MKLPADLLSLGRGSVNNSLKTLQFYRLQWHLVHKCALTVICTVHLIGTGCYTPVAWAGMS